MIIFDPDFGGFLEVAQEPLPPGTVVVDGQGNTVVDGQGNTVVTNT